MTIDSETGEIIPVFVRSAFNYDTEAASKESGLTCLDESRAQQQFKDECDINTIVERFGLTGELPEDPRIPLPEDFLEITNYHEAMTALVQAQELFMSYPAAIRERFANDPGRFVDYVSDPKNVEDARAWGLARPPEAPGEPIGVRLIPEPQPSAIAAPAPAPAVQAVPPAL